MNPRVAVLGAVLIASASAPAGFAAEMLRPAIERYADRETRETPDFQRHVLPLMGRLGCNTRSCHGSFQGRGGFRLSLFGYDFKMDHDSLMAKEEDRVDTEAPELSLILQKPTLGIPHKGGKRMDEESWQYQLLSRWIEDGAKPADGKSEFVRLEVSPVEVVFRKAGETVPLKVIAHWADGGAEDVTCITRFRTNDESIAEVDEDGLITSKGQGDTHVVAFYDNGVATTQIILPVSDKVGPGYPDVPTPTTVDRLVVEKLRKLGVVPSDVCSDSEFLRRVSLDMTGTLPSPDEISAFLADDSSRKRERKIDELLARPTYAARWAYKLCDLTGDSGANLQGQVGATQFAQDWYNWIYSRVERNVPYDDLIAGIVLGTSRRPGQDYEGYVAEQTTYHRDKDTGDFTERETMPYFWARRNLRKPEEKALAFSYTFLGVRLECAQCHKHPFDQWTQNDFNRFTTFFKPVSYGLTADGRSMTKDFLKEQGLEDKRGGDVRNASERLAKKGTPIPWPEVYLTRSGSPGRKKDSKDPKDANEDGPKVLGGEEVDLGDYKDPREPLMDWMRRGDNRYFARAFVNRVWAEYFNVGIVSPPDDLNLANPPSNGALLDHLTQGFISHDFDMKWLHREIATSQTYQRDWEANETNRLDERNFSRAVVRRLPAEIMLDAIAQATAGPDHMASVTTAIEDRTIGPKLGSAPGRRGSGDYAAKVFGRSTRDTNCDCSSSDEPNLLQAIFLQNDQDLLGAIERKKGWLDGLDLEKAKSDGQDVNGLIREVYLRTLSRPPIDREVERANDYFAQADGTEDGLRDLLWALLNTKEFATNH